MFTNFLFVFFHVLWFQPSKPKTINTFLSYIYINGSRERVDVFWKVGDGVTKGRKSQYAFDSLLADMSISSLAFLMQKYKKDLEEMKRNKEATSKEMQELKQRYNMVKEEYTYRFHHANLIEPDIYFTSTYDDIIVDYPLGKKKRLAILVSDSDVSYKELEELPK